MCDEQKCLYGAHDPVQRGSSQQARLVISVHVRICRSDPAKSLDRNDARVVLAESLEEVEVLLIVRLRRRDQVAAFAAVPVEKEHDHEIAFACRNIQRLHGTALAVVRMQPRDRPSRATPQCPLPACCSPIFM